ncbi:uncharacterized protein LOC141606291 [Silene latifolia]|uniref:uncharacterized protein LOC141606291 n=1 Tax=Silene latifolia TaxID=37657 RepID=UPI003D788BBD
MSASEPNSTILLHFPSGYGGDKNVPLWPQLGQLLFPSTLSGLGSKPLPQVSDMAAENAFNALQVNLFIREEVIRLMGEVNNLKERNAALESQLARTQGDNSSLSAGLKAAEDQALTLKKRLSNALVFAAWEFKIKLMKEFQAGEHTAWDVEEEERLFAAAFPTKPDLSILWDLVDSDEEEVHADEAVTQEDQTGDPTV